MIDLSAISGWFLSFTTIGGLTHLGGSQERTSKVYWSILFLLGACATIIQLSDILDNYLKFNVATSVRDEEVETHVFPAVTICNQNRVHCGNLYDLIQRTSEEESKPAWKALCDVYVNTFCEGSVFLARHFRYGIAKVEPVCEGVRVSGRNHSGPNKFNILEDQFTMFYSKLTKDQKQTISHQPEAMFHACTFDSIADSPPCKELLRGAVKIYNPLYGYCYTFNGGEQGRELMETPFSGPFYGFSVEINIERDYYMRVAATQYEGVAVAVHYPDKFPVMATDALSLLSNTLTRLALKENMAKRESEPYVTNCTSTWARSSVPELEGQVPYQSSLCQTKCLYHTMASWCNCSLQQLYTCEDYYEKQPCLVHSVDKHCLECGSRNLTKSYLKSNCICPPECEENYFEVMKHAIKWPADVFWAEVAYSHNVTYNGSVLQPGQKFQGLGPKNPELLEEYRAVKSHVEGNFLKLQVYFESKRIRSITETREYSLSQILSSTGGTISLWLGVSFIAIFELIELVCRFVMQLGKSKKSKPGYVFSPRSCSQE